MTTSVQPTLGDRSSKRVLYWHDDDAHSADNPENANASDLVVSPDDIEVAFVDADEELSSSSPLDVLLGAHILVDAADEAWKYIPRYNTFLTGLYCPDITYTADLGTYEIEAKRAVADITKATKQAQTYGADLVRQFNAYSNALTDVTNVSLLIESIAGTVREFLSAYVRDHGRAHVAHAEPDSTGLAFTDDTADYPPAPRNYSEVRVRISGADKVKPRRYTNEDNQAWGDVGLDAD